MSGFLATLLKGILTLFISNFPKFIERLFKKIPEKLSNEVQLIIDIVNIVKELVNTPLANIITDAIPGDKDKKLVEWLKMWLPSVLNELHLLQGGVFKLSEDPEVREGQLRAIASVLTHKYTGMPGDQSAITSAVVYRANTPKEIAVDENKADKAEDK